MTEPPFRSIAVVGLGLIGGSIALAVREHWPSARIAGVDRPSVLAHALGGGAIDRAVESVSALRDVDLVVLAAPVQQNVALLAEVARSSVARALSPVDSARGGPERAEGSGSPGATHTIVTDVGGTKRAIVAAASSLPSGVTFVGGHPLGGGERGGFAFARPDLFAGRPWIFTPDRAEARNAEADDLQDPGDAVARLSQFAAGLGADPMIMAAAEHDRLMAYVSHLPQLAASALMEIVGAAATADGLRMAGKGLFDTTRLASSPADVWRDICATNADAIGPALDHLIARLTELRADLSGGAAIDEVFDEAARWRAELMKSATR